jgi:hypothetical protein
MVDLGNHSQKESVSTEQARGSSDPGLPHSSSREKVLQALKQETAARLAVLTPENVREQREFIEDTVKDVESQLVYCHDGRVTNILKELRAVALGAFVRSFVVAPPSAVELVKFCQEYVPDARLRKDSDTTITVRGLLDEIRKLPRRGSDHVRAVVAAIPVAAGSQKKIAERILSYLCDTES